VFTARSRVTGYTGKQTVSYIFRQQDGSLGVNAAIASVYTHGGGGGDLFRGVASSTDATVMASIGATGHVLGASFYSGGVTVANDAVTTITPPNVSGMIEVFAEGTSTSFGKRFYRVGASPAMAVAYSGTTFASTTGDLTGTTGTVGNLTISARVDGTIQLENRTGADRLLVWIYNAR
jgi:hypothetical protein